MLEGIAKIAWTDPDSNTLQEVILTEGVKITIGRGQDNDIYIPERHVSRMHAEIRYEYGVFVIEDLGSANGVFINDDKIAEPYPLIAGDTIRLFKPTLSFAAVVSQQEIDEAHKTGSLLRPKTSRGRAKITIVAGQQTGLEIPLFQEKVVFGRATTNAEWDIKLRDHAVSRPHAQIELKNDIWNITDLGSSNGTLVNGIPVSQSIPLHDGVEILMGETKMIFKEGS